jgi:mRNA interferase RelE/StbE
MQWFAAQENPLSFAKKLTDPLLGDYRFRVGDYRVLVDIKDGKIRILVVLTVQHRKDVYRI